MNTDIKNTTKQTIASTEIFAWNLQYLMKNKGVMPSELAKDLNISPFRVDRWLRKICYPKNDLLIALCDYFEYKDIYSLLTVKFD